MGDYADILAEARIRQILRGVGDDSSVAGEVAERIVRAASSSAVKVQKGQVILTFDLLDGGAEPDADGAEEGPAPDAGRPLSAVDD